MMLWEEMTNREKLEAFIWDAYKDAYGVRPRGVYDFDAMSEAELEEEADRLSDAVVEEIERERAEKAKAVRMFRAKLRAIMRYGANDRKTAMRWILEGNGAIGECDAGYMCYKMGLPYSMEKYIRPVLMEINAKERVM
jgi:predicted DNA-binding protein (UPF0278 family)